MMQEYWEKEQTGTVAFLCLFTDSVDLDVRINQTGFSDFNFCSPRVLAKPFIESDTLKIAGVLITCFSSVLLFYPSPEFISLF